MKRFIHLIAILCLLGACKPKPPGNFGRNPKKKHSATVKIPRKNNLNDCDAMERQRDKNVKTARNENKKEYKFQKKVKKLEAKGKIQKIDELNAKREEKKRKAYDKQQKKKYSAGSLGKGWKIIVAIGFGIAFGIFAIAFIAVAIATFIISLALSALFVPVAIAIASTVISLIAVAFLKLGQEIWKGHQRRVLRKKERRKEKQKYETPGG